MNTVLEESAQEVFQETSEKKYIRLDYEDIKNISDELIEQNMNAYLVLANA
ncbi:MAG: hypothetical protein IJG34_01955 [Synergistaceae bacterium]|nr:hypothetical protein [Synergistaceae bacterium]MBQ3448648.1 hypothetical protein [Synergistaceae bacterium]MBQ3694544.1 hypothetical protein [Synergistaceae bacterium]MBQ9629735.1 hypothetical protein [Synergistaceae bacterium]MBR0068883.1 hypothetical protein [Synergistaceae bacterium]